MDALEFIGEEIERHASREIHSVVNGISPEERARTNSQVMRAILRDRASNRRRSLCRDTLADRDRIPSGHDNQLVTCQLGFAHAVEFA